MKFSTPCDLVAAALVAVSSELEDPGKNRKVNAGQRSYSYAELDKCLPDLRALCASKGIFITQSAVGETMVTTLLHASGQWGESECPIVMPGKAGDPQAFGSSVTYARRYGLFMALGIAAQNEDNDGDIKGRAPARKEPPDQREARRADHHPSWTEEEQRRFIGKLSSAGYKNFDRVCVFLVNAQQRRKPSQMDQEERDGIEKKLLMAKSKESFAAWEKDFYAEGGEQAGGEA